MLVKELTSQKMSFRKLIIFYSVIVSGISHIWMSHGFGITKESFIAIGSVSSAIGQIHETFARSRLDCLIICTQNQQCSSAFFDTENGTCRMFDTIGPLELINTPVGYSMVYTRFSHLYSSIIIYNMGEPNTSSSESSTVMITIPECPHREIKKVKLTPNSIPFEVRCFDSGITIQENGDTSTSQYNKDISAFRNGIGGVHATGKYMMKLDQIHNLTASAALSLVIKPHWDHEFKLSDFRVGNSSTNYLMTFSECYYLSPSAANCKQSLLNLNGTKFSTSNSDHDGNSSINCALEAKSGFWYSTDCNLRNFKYVDKTYYLSLSRIGRMSLKSNEYSISQ